MSNHENPYWFVVRYTSPVPACNADRAMVTDVTRCDRWRVGLGPGLGPQLTLSWFQLGC